MNTRDIQVLHIEPTDVCQAACPACARETDTEFDKKQQHHLTVAQIDQAIARPTLTNLHKMFMCGNYGDPAAARHGLEIYRWFRSINPDIVLGMNTNGGIRDAAWWKELAEIMTGPRDYVVFSIDGLEDTNHRYRVRVDWSRVMTNAASFISAGGSAHWDMLVYRHNQHQVDEARALAHQMGFSWFRAKHSRRPLTAGLEHAVDFRPVSVPPGEIRCHALADSSIYMDAQARVHPCCWLGSRQRDFYFNFDQVQASWHTARPNEICRATCSVSANSTQFQQQWIREVQLC
jgi:MoaA/NifB/PqqE/SkfB family radical SAM enzyme